MQEGVADAARLYFDGGAVAARDLLIRLLDSPEARAPAVRAAVLDALLDTCARSSAVDCLTTYAPRYAEAAAAAPAANDILRQDQALRAGYYADAARFRLGRPEVTAKILEGAAWSHENAYDGALYLRRQALAADILLAEGQAAAAVRRADRMLSLLASLKTPQADRFAVAYGLTDAIRILTAAGQTERAYGLYRTSAGSIAQILSPRSVDAGIFHLAEARLLEAVGDVPGASQAADAAVAILRATELDEPVRAGLMCEALDLQAFLRAARGDLAGADAALAAHPLAAAFAGGGHAAGSAAEVDYLAVRAIVAALQGRPDPATAEGLAQPLPAQGAADTDRTELHRLAGRALSLPAGVERAAAVAELGRRFRDVAAAPRARTPGAWYRPGAIDQVLIGLALTPMAAGRPGPGDADVAFALFQLAARQGPSFDADALSALSQARDPLTRRSIHEALRLRQRRDRLERAAIQAVAQATAAGRPPLGNLDHDFPVRQQFRLFAERIAAVDRRLATEGLVLGGANIAPLARFQAVLAPDEAALIVTPSGEGLAYMCVRRETTFRAFAAADIGRLKLDVRLLQAALSAAYAPSEDLDAQFPADAAVRLHDAFIRPFAPCLKPGDRILWLPGVASVGLPLAALLPQAPPRAGEGYDLAQADWLAKAHATSYAGSAAAVLAARATARAAPAFDFLGVGDPVLTGRTAEGEARGRAVLRGVRGGAFADLPALPETKDELVASAQGFRQARLLTEAEATERRFRGEMVGAYRMLSFATHGLLRDDLQGLAEPALVLTPVSTRDPGDDGLLTASEIADFNLSAEFVALSACNTANFDLGQAAEDLPALASAFAVAGVPSTLGTLWPVNSETGKRVVAATFAGLRENRARGPAQALAEAQRAFLASPPGRAYLHPRFWAPFVILGDGGAAPPTAAAGPRLAAVETLAAGGEGLSVRRDGAGALARFIGAPAADGRHRSGLRAVTARGAEAWRQDLAGPGASPFMAVLGARVVAAGYETTAQGPIVPILQAFDRTTGALAATWRADARGADLSAILGGAVTGSSQAVVAIADVVRAKGEPPTLRAMGLDARLQPRTLFETRAGRGGRIDAATLTPFRGDLLLTFTVRDAPLALPPAVGWDDYDDALCLSEPVTWIELRDGRTGALKASREVPGLDVAAAMAHGRDVWLAGATQAACGEDEHATVQALDPRLRTRALYADASVGASWIWSLSPMPGGGAFAAGSKQAVVDFRALRGVEPAGLGAPTGTSGLLFSLASDGRPSPPTLLASGADVYVNGADASRPDEVLLAGALGGRAVVFHVAANPAP